MFRTVRSLRNRDRRGLTGNGYDFPMESRLDHSGHFSHREKPNSDLTQQKQSTSRFKFLTVRIFSDHGYYPPSPLRGEGDLGFPTRSGHRDHFPLNVTCPLQPYQSVGERSRGLQVN